MIGVLIGLIIAISALLFVKNNPNSSYEDVEAASFTLMLCYIALAGVVIYLIWN